MGQEARCITRFGGVVSEGRALLESEELLFRGEFRLRIPFREIRSLEARDGRLEVTLEEGVATFELGPLAERWAERIRNPKSLIDKLGVRAGARVAVLGLEDEHFLALLRGRTPNIAQDEGGGGFDLIFLLAERGSDLDRLSGLEQALERSGAIWVVAPRGREPSEADVLAAGRANDLVDTKVVRFSETHTAHRFAIPRARR